RRSVSDDTAKAIDAEVKEIVETAHETALNILRDNRDLMETIVEQILDTEVIEGAALQELLDRVKYEGDLTPAPAS
ncbi:MAG: cell division protein FtsH, partial [Limnospira sp.]